MYSREIMNKIKEEARKQYPSDDIIFKLAKELVESDDGYEYARIWMSCFTRNTYMQFEYYVKYYSDCEENVVFEKTKESLRERFKELEIGDIDITDVEVDESLADGEFDLIIRDGE